jgi:multidrug transporter EmrE-like cation transporter
MHNAIVWIIFTLAAGLEVGGDALIRKGLRTHGIWLIVLGFTILGCYGLVVNLVKWDFSKLLGVYVAVFALLSICTARFFFKEHIPIPTWIGLALIVVGGLTIQFGQR